MSKGSDNQKCAITAHNASTCNDTSQKGWSSGKTVCFKLQLPAIEETPMEVKSHPPKFVEFPN
jgi:hypothetical protein